MTKGLNKVQLIGRLGAPPRLRFTPEGNAVTTFRIAVDRPWKDRAGARQVDTDWFTVLVWEALGETCQQFLTTGRLVYVEGRLQQRTREQGGQPQRTVVVIAQDVLFLDNRPDDDGVAEPAVTPPPRPPSGSRPAAKERRAPRRQPAAALADRNVQPTFEEEALPL